VYQIHKTIRHHFPDLFEKLNELKDCRKRSDYSLAAIISGALAMFLFKQGSRNAMNNDGKKEKFRKNYERLFGLPLPHMDTVNGVMAGLSSEQLEELKRSLIQTLLKRRVWHKYRLFNKYFKVAIDATGVYTFDEEPYEGCPFRQYKKKKVWIQPVLEAKLVTATGFSISVCTTWILNGEAFKKQDCERKAFVRLAEKLKRAFPRLPICILADGLYPYQTFFEICKKNDWSFIVTFKDGSLKSVWRHIDEHLPDFPGNKTSAYRAVNRDKAECDEYTWFNNIDYHGYKIHWLETLETKKNLGTKQVKEQRFVHLTSFAIELKTAAVICFAGRTRWKIENEGFKCQKREGYALQHKYARKNLTAIKNYYQCMQIAHLINQLATLCKVVQNHLKQDRKLTIKDFWKDLSALMIAGHIDQELIQTHQKGRFQFRY
jgi:hypothetical protein